MVEQGANTTIKSNAGRSLNDLTGRSRSVLFSVEDGEEVLKAIQEETTFSDEELEGLSRPFNGNDESRFNWTSCQMDQLFAFEAVDISHIVQGTTII